MSSEKSRYTRPAPAGSTTSINVWLCATTSTGSRTSPTPAPVRVSTVTAKGLAEEPSEVPQMRRGSRSPTLGG